MRRQANNGAELSRLEFARVDFPVRGNSRSAANDCVESRFCAATLTHQQCQYSDIELDEIEMTSSLDEMAPRAAQSRMDPAYKCQLLYTYIPIASKMAFLSVVTDDRRQLKKRVALKLLDSNLVPLIFKFAASREVRRTIAWNVSTRTRPGR